MTIMKSYYVDQIVYSIHCFLSAFNLNIYSSLPLSIFKEVYPYDFVHNIVVTMAKK